MDDKYIIVNGKKVKCNKKHKLYEKMTLKEIDELIVKKRSELAKKNQTD